MLNIKDMDLNLLVSLDKLLELRSVSLAAKEVGVTQPAMSNILSRLRESLGDPLLVKVGRDMNMTPRAANIRAPLKNLLNEIQIQILEDRPFDPGEDELHLKLAFHDYEQLVINTKIYPKILSECKNVSLEHVHPDSAHPTDALASGRADFSTGPILEARAGIYRKKLFSDRFVCLFDKKKTKLPPGKVSLKKYCELDHIFIAPHGGTTGQADDILQSKGLKRKVRISVAEFSICPWVLSESKTIATLPERVADIFKNRWKNLKIGSCPVDIPPFDIYLSWHTRLNSSPAHLWFKNLVSEQLT